MVTIGRGGYDSSKRGYDPRQPQFASGVKIRTAPSAAAATLAPSTMQFPVREQIINESSFGAVSKRMGEEDKAGVLGATARRRGASRALLG